MMNSLNAPRTPEMATDSNDCGPAKSPTTKTTTAERTWHCVACSPFGVEATPNASTAYSGALA